MNKGSLSKVVDSAWAQSPEAPDDIEFSQEILNGPNGVRDALRYAFPTGEAIPKTLVIQGNNVQIGYDKAQETAEQLVRHVKFQECLFRLIDMMIQQPWLQLREKLGVEETPQERTWENYSELADHLSSSSLRPRILRALKDLLLFGDLFSESELKAALSHYIFPAMERNLRKFDTLERDVNSFDEECAKWEGSITAVIEKLASSDQTS